MILKFLRRLLHQPLPSALPILAEIDNRGVGLSAFSYGGFNNVPRTYNVTIVHEGGGVRCSASGEGATFDEALGRAWLKWPERGA